MDAPVKKETMSDAEVEKYLADIIGPMGHPDSLLIEHGAVRRMALAVDSTDPIHFDHDYAVSKGYRGIVAPWPIVWLLWTHCSDHHFHKALPFGKATVHGQDEYSFHEPIIVGDTITVHTSMAETKLKQGKSGRLGQLVEERRHVNQNGQLCVTLRTTLFRR